MKDIPNQMELKKVIAWWLSKLQVETVKNHRPVMITREDEKVLEKVIEGVMEALRKQNEFVIGEDYVLYGTGTDNDRQVINYEKADQRQRSKESLGENDG